MYCAGVHAEHVPCTWRLHGMQDLPWFDLITDGPAVSHTDGCRCLASLINNVRLCVCSLPLNSSRLF